MTPFGDGCVALRDGRAAFDQSGAKGSTGTLAQPSRTVRPQSKPNKDVWDMDQGLSPRSVIATGARGGKGLAAIRTLPGTGAGVDACEMNEDALDDAHNPSDHGPLLTAMDTWNKVTAVSPPTRPCGGCQELARVGRLVIAGFSTIRHWLMY